MSINGHNGFAAVVGDLQVRWDFEERQQGIKRAYSPQDVLSLRGSLQIEHTVARAGAERLWSLLHTEPFIRTFGALTGSQAVQMVKAGLQAIYLSGWQVAADANLAGQTYPDQSLYPSNSVPTLIRRINSALMRADQVAHLNGEHGPHWFAPIVADAEAGFGGPIHSYELMKSMIEAGAVPPERATSLLMNLRRSSSPSVKLLNTSSWLCCIAVFPDQCWVRKTTVPSVA